jgi:hypothetical protein
MSSRAEQAAAQLVQKYGLAQPADIDLPAICWGESLLATEGPIGCADAWLVSLGKMGIARIREDIPFPGQKRFALAHELGHWLLHDSKGQTWYDDDRSLADYRQDPREMEANLFASSVLVPMPMLEAEFGGVKASLVLAALIADSFQTGPILAARRMVAMENVNALLLVSDDQKVLYYSRSEQCTLPSILPNTLVPEGPTQEAACSVGVLHKARVEAQSWSKKAKGHYINEESYRPAVDSPVITLITFT